jgi:hypothetical protein
MEPALAHWLNTMHPTPGNTASDRLGDAARAVEPKDPGVYRRQLKAVARAIHAHRVASEDAEVIAEDLLQGGQRPAGAAAAVEEAGGMGVLGGSRAAWRPS